MNRRQIFKVFLSFLGGGIIASIFFGKSKRKSVGVTEQNILTSMPSHLFYSNQEFKIVTGGKVYIGKVGSDPAQSQNQIQVYLKNESGNLLPVSQPIAINKSGYLAHDEQVSDFMIMDNYSMAVYDEYNTLHSYSTHTLKNNQSQDHYRLKKEINCGDEIKPELTLVGKCTDIATLRTIIPSQNPQWIEVIAYYNNSTDYITQHAALGGGHFEAMQDTFTNDDGGSFIRVNTSWGWKRIVHNSVTLHDFGANGTLTNDEPAKNNALKFCSAAKLDLDLLPGNYYFSSPIIWESRNYSIISKGNVVFDFTNCSTGTYAIRVAEQAQNEGTIWHGITKSISGIIFHGKVGMHGLIIDQKNEFSTPAINIDNCFFNEFNDHVTFGDNEWACAFKRCFFRGNTAGMSRFIVVNKIYNGCENQRFEACIFSGNQSTQAIKHITGSCEFTFDGCSFDYNRGVLQSITPNTRGIWRFTNCHFEDDGLVNNFDINTGSSACYIDFIGCDWYFTNKLPSKIGVFKSTNSASTLNIIACKLTMFQETQDRSVVDLFTSGLSTDRFKINMDGNTVEMATNQYFNVLCATNNLYANFTKDNLTNGQFFFSGVGTIIFTNDDYPIGSTTQTWIITGRQEAYSYSTFNPNKRLAISGWFRKSGDYYVEVAFINTENIIIDNQILGIPGANDVWAKFGQPIYPPVGTSKIRLGWGFQAKITAEDTLAVNNWIIEQY